jgi:hypothetical protein
MKPIPKLTHIAAISLIMASYPALAASGPNTGGSGANAGGSAGSTGTIGSGTGSAAGASGGVSDHSIGSSASTSAERDRTGSASADSDTMGTSSTGATATGSTTLSSTDWDAENRYWRNNFSSRPYAKGKDYSAYEPAYRYGLETYNQNPGMRFEDIDQSRLRTGWNQARGTSTLGWDDARLATRDAYNRALQQDQNGATSGSTSQ